MDEITRLYQAFDPIRPLTTSEPDAELYVDWQKIASPDDIKVEIANSIARSGGAALPRLLTGHRGVGKTTELYRVKRQLEKEGFFVSILLAQDFLDLADVQAPELVFQIARKLAEDLGISYWNRLTAFVAEIGEILDQDVYLKSLEVGVDPVKLGIALRDAPGPRARLRQLLEPRLPKLEDLINRDILAPAQRNRPVALIVDQLDRMPRANQEALFVGEAKTLKSLNCAVLYTIPIELASGRLQNALSVEYGHRVLTLPAIPVVNQDGVASERGLECLRNLVGRRMKGARLFETDALLERYLHWSGGHVTTLFGLIRSSLDRSSSLPITVETAGRMVRSHAADSAQPLNRIDWDVIDYVHQEKRRPDGQEERFSELLRDLYLYAYRNEDGTLYYDWNPLLGEVRRR